MRKEKQILRWGAQDDLRACFAATHESVLIMGTDQIRLKVFLQCHSEELSDEESAFAVLASKPRFTTLVSPAQIYFSRPRQSSARRLPLVGSVARRVAAPHG